MIINNQSIAKGSNKLIRLNVSKLPSGTPIDIQANIFRSKVDGPTVLILGGLHGDEINGVEIVRRALADKYFNTLKKGSVIAIPLLNVYGFNNFSREVPDGKDINRSFPGTTKGSLASQVARKLGKEILPHVDCGIDFHTGGASIYNVPQIRIAPNDEQAFTLAEKFNTQFIVYSNLIPKSLRKEMSKLNKPMVVFEGGESLRLDELSIEEGLKGITNVLSHLEMIDKVNNTQESKVIKESTWQRALVAGIFVSLIKSGDFVAKNQVIGNIATPYGKIIKEIKAKKEGYVYGLNNSPVVNRGDALFHIGK